MSNFLLNNGFNVENVVITGNNFTNKEKILNIIDKTQTITYISLTKLRSDIKSANEWVKDVNVYRMLPNTLHIEISEHKPFAIWKNNGQTSIIDHEGQVIIPNYLLGELMTISGQNALSNLSFVHDILSDKTQLSRKISSFTYVGNRRWDITFSNNTAVKLPERNPYIAWEYLNRLYNTTDFTLNDWSVIDMRVTDKIFVKR